MDLSDKVKLADWIKERWDDVDESITVRTALGSGYGHSRSAKDAIYDKVIPMLEQLTSEGGATAADDALSETLNTKLLETLTEQLPNADPEDLKAASRKAVKAALAD